MARFDVYSYDRFGASYLLDVQADILSGLKTRMMIPLVALSVAGPQTYPRLKPVLEIEGAQYVLMTTDMAVMAIRGLSRPVANLEHSRHVIVDSIDFLLQGY